jgi:cation diffusion facilitator family transporter
VSPELRFPLILSILAAVLTLGLKTLAWAMTDSVSLLSDALESLINLVASVAACLSVSYAARPVDADHTYGHQKIEYFASGFEGSLILVAAGAIAWQAISRLFSPQPLEQLGAGLAVLLLAACINGTVAILLLRAGRRHRSIVLEADGQHLLTDVWTSGGVLVGLGLVMLTGWHFLDPLVALLVSANILWTAVQLMRRSFDGLMDRALPLEEQHRLRQAIESQLLPNMAYHALRTRQAGPQLFIDFHLLVPGQMTVQEAHDRGDLIEAALQTAHPGIEVTIHIEPIEQRSAWHDSELLAVERAQQRRRNAAE